MGTPLDQATPPADIGIAPGTLISVSVQLPVADILNLGSRAPANEVSIDRVLLAALNVACPSSRITPDDMHKRILLELRAASQEITAGLQT